MTSKGRKTYKTSAKRELAIFKRCSADKRSLGFILKQKNPRIQLDRRSKSSIAFNVDMKSPKGSWWASKKAFLSSKVFHRDKTLDISFISRKSLKVSSWPFGNRQHLKPHWNDLLRDKHVLGVPQSWKI